VDFLAAGEGASQFVGTLTMRIRMILADRRLGPLLVPEKQITFAQWLEDHVGSSQAENGQVAILDLSLVPSDVLPGIRFVPFIPSAQKRFISMKDYPFIIRSKVRNLD